MVRPDHQPDESPSKNLRQVDSPAPAVSFGTADGKNKMLSVGNPLEIERALTKQERNRILDAADQLLLVGGRSRDRHRNGGVIPPQRKNYRPYRNRAIVYTPY